MVERAPRPNWWRVGTGLIAAPPIAALVFSAFFVATGYPLATGYAPAIRPSIIVGSFLTAYVPAVTFGGYLPMLLLGVPAILILSRWLRPTMLNCALGGAVVAVLPWATVMALSRPYEATLERSPTLIQVTGRLLREHVNYIGGIAAFGAFGGIIFWLFAASDLSRFRRSA